MRSGLWCLVLSACVTTRLPFSTRTAQATTDATTCTTYAPFAARVRALREEAPRAVSSGQLLEMTAQLEQLRAACGKATLEHLASVAASSRDFQAELDAMAPDFPGDALRHLVHAALGPRARELSAEVAMAVATAANAHDSPQRASLALAAPTRVDDAHQPDVSLDAPLAQQAAQCLKERPIAGLACLRALPRDVSTRPVAATLVERGLAAVDATPIAERAEAAAELLRAEDGVGTNDVHQRVLDALDGLCRSRWPLVKQLQARDELLRAAVLALPCRTSATLGPEAWVLDNAAATAETTLATSLRAQGMARAALLHEAVAATLRGVAGPTGALDVGAWDLTRLEGCPRVRAPEAVPEGLLLRVLGRCRTQAPKQSSTRGDDKLFEGERAMASMVVQGQVLAGCAGEVREFPLLVRDVVIGGFSSDEPGAALEGRLEAVKAEATTWCRQQRSRSVEVDCQRLQLRSAAEVEQRFVEHAQALGQWPSCFESWHLARTGLRPPRVWTQP